MVVAAGAIADAADVNALRMKFKKKAAAESVTNSAALQNDDDLVFTLQAGKQYIVEAHLAVSGPAAQDVRIAWAISGGITVKANRMVTGPPSSTAGATDTTVRATGTHALTTNIIYGTDGTNSSHIIEWFAIETVTLNATGTLTLQWAQGTAAAATTTTMQSTSWVTLTEIEDWV